MGKKMGDVGHCVYERDFGRSVPSGRSSGVGGPPISDSIAIRVLILFAVMAMIAVPAGAIESASSMVMTVRRQNVPHEVVKKQRPAPVRKRPAAIQRRENSVVAPWRWYVPQPTNAGGSFLVGIGDIDADGFGDLAIGTPQFNRDGTNRSGAVFFFRGSESGPKPRPDLELWGPHSEGQFGFQVVGAGDINNDGYDDVAVACAGLVSPYRVFVFLGSSRGLGPDPDWHFEPPADCPGCYVGTSALGDVNGDGFADLGIGLYCDHHGSNQECRLLVFHGSSAGLCSTPAWVASGMKSFGEIQPAGDVNGDGCSDVLASFPDHAGQVKGEGVVFLFHGSSDGLGVEAAWNVDHRPADGALGSGRDQHFGNVAGSAGDVNGDGFADVLITAWFADHGEVNEGIAFVYHGSRTGQARKPSWSAEANQAHALFGCSAAGLGDVNGDGFSDIVIGAKQASHGQLLEGACAVFLGSRSGLEPKPAWTAESDLTHGQFGSFVAAAGDVNGDGLADLAVSAPGQVGALGNTPYVQLYFGTRRGFQNSSAWQIDPPDAPVSGRPWGAATILAGAFMATLVAVVSRVTERNRVARLKAVSDREARQAERESLVRDLHDNIGPEIARIARVSGPSVAREIATVVQSFDQTLWMTSPRHDTLESLVMFISQQADRMFENTSMKVIFRQPPQLPERSISPQLRKAVYLAVKEALHNSIKHSGGQEVRLELTECNGVLGIRISDDGCGISERIRHFGQGLANMRRRIESVDGQFKIERPLSGGAAVSFSVPLNRGEG